MTEAPPKIKERFHQVCSLPHFVKNLRSTQPILRLACPAKSLPRPFPHPSIRNFP